MKHSSLADELKKRIKALKNLSKTLAQQTEYCIETIRTLYFSTYTNITKTIKYYKNILVKKINSTSEIEEIRKTLKTEITISTPDCYDLITEIKKFFLHNFIRFDSDTQKKKEMKDQFIQGHNSGFTCLAISNNTRTLLTGSEDATVRVWDLLKMEQVVCFAKHNKEVKCLAISKNSFTAISGSLDKKVILWDLKNRCLKNIYTGHSGPVLCVKFSYDEKVIISGSSAYEIRIWSINSFKCLKKIVTNYGTFDGLIFLENQFISASYDHLEKWDLIDYIKLNSIQAHTQVINSISITKNNQYIITGSKDKSVKIWNTGSLTLFASYIEHTSGVLSVSSTLNNNNIISGSEDKTIVIWSLITKLIVFRLTDHKGPINGVISTETKIISVSSDSRIGLFNLISQQLESFLNLKPFRLGSETIKDNLIAFGRGNNVIIYDSNNNCEIVLTGHSGIVHALCFSSKKEFLISSACCNEKNLIIWDLKNHSCLSQLNGHWSSVFCVDVSADDLHAISGDANSKVRYWNLKSFTEIFVFEGHIGHVYSVKFTKSGEFAASGGNDLKVMIWNLINRDLHASLDGHCQSIMKVLITCDDKFVVSVSEIDGIFVWNINRKIRKHCFRRLDEAEKWLVNYKDIRDEIVSFLVRN